MSQQVTSQFKGHSDFQGITVTVSTLFPSERDNPVGSKMDETSIEARVDLTTLFRGDTLPTMQTVGT